MATASATHDILVCAERQAMPATRWLVRELGPRARTVVLERAGRLQKGRQFIVYLQGPEPLPEVRSFLRKVRAKNYNWLVLYAPHHSLEAAAKIGFVAGQELPKQAQFAFDAQRLRECLKTLNIPFHGGAARQPLLSGDSLTRVRKRLGLTQQEMAHALHVTPRTIQNWERNVATGQIKRKTHDLRELLELVDDYVVPGKEPEWLKTSLEALGGKKPFDLIVEGKLRDLIVEFRRLQEGQPV
jgi:transcriptional regulator with XRE-family HTH domain